MRDLDYLLPGQEPDPPNVLRDAQAYLDTAGDTKATALIARLSDEVRTLRLVMSNVLDACERGRPLPDIHDRLKVEVTAAGRR